MNSANLRRALAAAGPDDVPNLFWAAFGWAGWINLSKDSPQALTEIPTVVAVMHRVMRLSPGYHFAGPQLFFGAYYASRPAILGGNIKKAKKYFERAVKMTSGKYLMAYVLEARYLAVDSQDKAFFQNLLRRVQDLPAGGLPGALLTDQVAKQKAAALLERTNDYF